ncbi:tetratricopeptide repeat protein [Hyalangium rubrum]|uniref:Outer membrane protein assembly factor BamD n=1 Tax=Hyalangium rubrum TaxID=3103134 RepID=A0ABU5H3K8_9BACT|nr:outer membrane protein assembly factor BamD [Hyalangium sp. s54d21]MDY7227906.1 outer membrane protein assembly factor BamD [Hyalangium sp. s54d21]
MATEQKPVEVDKELSEIRKEVIEARNLVIKTDNLLKNLHAEVKAVGKRHEDFQRRQWISSGVAYALFAILVVGGAVMVSNARTSTAGAERERLEKNVAELTSQLEKQRAEVAANQTAQRSANEVYKLMTTLPGDERLKGIDALVKLDTTRLSGLERQALNDRAELLRKEIGQSAFERGKAAFRRNDMKGAAEDLARFMAMNPTEADALDASFFLGAAYNSTNQHEKAVPLLVRFVDGDKKSKTRDYAMVLLAQSYQETHQLDKALETVRDAIASYPATQYLGAMRARLNSVKRQMGGPEAAAAPVPAPAVAAPAPQPTTPAAAAPAPTPAPPAAATPAPR